MTGDWTRYRDLFQRGATLYAVYLTGKADGLDTISLIRMLRDVAGLSLNEAKEVHIVAKGWGTSLEDYQEKWIPGVQAFLDAKGWSGNNAEADGTRDTPVPPK